MANIFGIALFALGIAGTIALHEAGHMATARACGMRVRRFFIGFGPRIASFRRGNTEYGFAALPVGGFCDIAGMTSQDEVLTEEERPHAMFAKPWWQRILVLSGGIAVNLALGFSILLGLAVTSGLPNPDADVRPRVGELTCSADQRLDQSLKECSGSGPAAAAGVKPGDVVTSFAGQEIQDFTQLRDAALQRPGETVTLGLERQGQPREVEVTLDTVQRLGSDGQLHEAGSLGMSNQLIDIVEKHDAAGAVPAAWRYSTYALDATVRGIAQFPAKIPGVLASIFGAERDVNGPMSVVGASRVGGELVERNMWPSFFLMLASLNYFLALFNLIPLPPLDGGHIAVVLYEKIRDGLRRLRGLAPAGPADYTKLLPLTYAMASALMVLGAITIVADVVNPIRLFG